MNRTGLVTSSSDGSYPLCALTYSIFFVYSIISKYILIYLICYSNVTTIINCSHNNHQNDSRPPDTSKVSLMAGLQPLWWLCQLRLCWRLARPLVTPRYGTDNGWGPVRTSWKRRRNSTSNSTWQENMVPPTTKTIGGRRCSTHFKNHGFSAGTTTLEREFFWGPEARMGQLRCALRCASEAQRVAGEAAVWGAAVGQTWLSRWCSFPWKIHWTGGIFFGNISLFLGGFGSATPI